MGKCRDNDITCMCGAYDHPHRLGGGSCDAAAWCTAYRAIDSFECEACNHGGDGACDIVTGADVINRDTCECVAGEIRSRALQDEYGYLPLDIEEYYEKQWREYNEH